MDGRREQSPCFGTSSARVLYEEGIGDHFLPQKTGGPPHITHALAHQGATKLFVPPLEESYPIRQELALP
jgi:hypothetical protein